MWFMYYSKMVPTQLVNSFTIHSISNYCKLKTKAKHLQQLYKATECQYNNFLRSIIYRSVLSPSNPANLNRNLGHLLAQLYFGRQQQIRAYGRVHSHDVLAFTTTRVMTFGRSTDVLRRRSRKVSVFSVEVFFTV